MLKGHAFRPSAGRMQPGSAFDPERLAVPASDSHVTTLVHFAIPGTAPAM